MNFRLFFFEQSLNPPVLIFVQDVARAKQLYRELASTDIKVDVTYGDLPQEQVMYFSFMVMQVALASHDQNLG